jgi:hypothetical protein
MIMTANLGKNQSKEFRSHFCITTGAFIFVTKMDRERDKRSFFKGTFLKIGSKINAKLQNLQKRHHGTSTTAGMSNFHESATIDATDVTFDGNNCVYIKFIHIFSVVKIMLVLY